MTARAARGAGAGPATSGTAPGGRRSAAPRAGEARGGRSRARKSATPPAPEDQPTPGTRTPEPDGYSGLDWDLHHLARCGKTDTAVGPGLVGYGLWVHVVRANLPSPAAPDVPTGAVLQ